MRPGCNLYAVLWRPTLYLQPPLPPCGRYAALVPNDATRLLAEQRARALFYGRPYAALHIRRTDHLTAIRPADQTRDDAFDAFLDTAQSAAEGAPLPVYLATDNADTQARLTSRHGARVRVHRAISPRPGALRQTSLKDAVLDLLVCAASRIFMGSHGSSFSDTIAHMRATRARASADDRHVIMR